MPIDSMMTPYSAEDEAGPVDVVLPGDPMPEEQEAPAAAGHRDNLAEFMKDDELVQIASNILEDYENDADSRKDWLSTYTKGLDYLGFKMEDRTRPFKNAAGVYHPIMSEAVIRFQSNAIIEIFPAAGPVLTQVLGDETPDKMNQAKRIKEEFNYQLTENMCEYRTEKEQLLFRLPIAGSCFKKVYYDQMKKRPSACMVVAEDLVVNYGATDLENCDRIFHVMRRSDNDVKKMMRAGLYMQMDLPKPVQVQPEGRIKEDKVTGMTPRLDRDNRRTIIEAHCYYNMPGILEDPNGIADPYIVTIDKDTRKVLAIYRNWAEDDNEDRNREQYFVHYQYMPGLGFYGFGLAHLMGSIAKGATSILRQLIDAGTLANLPGGLKTKGLRVKGDDTPIQPGEWRDVDVPPGGIGENLYPLPYKEPSAVLVSLLEMLVEEGRRIGSIADVEIGSSQANAPVGTTMALLERSLKVMSAVHARLHASLRKELRLIGKVISDYMGPKYDWDESGQFDRKADFDARVDVLPVSDPNAATMAQRIVQLQAVQQMAQLSPELYNMKELHRAALNIIGWKNDERILPLDEPPPLMDPVQENMAILTSQPIKVYQEQDHTAHIQVHLSFINDPKILEMVLASPNAARLQGAMEAHVAEHLAFQYREEMQQIMGVELPAPGQPLPPEVESHLSRLVADASIRLREKHDAEAQAKANEEMANDPVFALREREIAVKEGKLALDAQNAQADRVVEIAKEAGKEAMDLRRIESEEARAGAQIGANLITFGLEANAAERESGIQLGKEAMMAIHDAQQEMTKLNVDSAHRTLDRQAMLEGKRMDADAKKAAAKAKPKPKPAGK